MARTSRSKLANRVVPVELPNRAKRLRLQPNNRQTGPASRIPRERTSKGRSQSPKEIESQRFYVTDKAAGTALAIKGIDIGSATLDVSATLQRGRRSTALRRKDIENIRAAAVYTAQEQRALNRFTTIHFEAASLADPVCAIGRMMKLAGDWLRTKGAVLTYIWVREAGKTKGDHVHILWHVPHTLIRDFAKREPGWRKRIGAKPKRGAFKTKPVGLSYSHGALQVQFGQQYSHAANGVLDYIVKGVEPEAAIGLELARLVPGGELWGKRHGISENINRTARLRALK